MAEPCEQGLKQQGNEHFVLDYKCILSLLNEAGTHGLAERGFVFPTGVEDSTRSRGFDFQRRLMPDQFFPIQKTRTSTPLCPGWKKVVSEG